MDCGQLDLNSLKLKLYAEFDQWQDFVAAVDEFQNKTSIKLTITTSRKLKSRVRGSKRQRTVKKSREDGNEESNDSSVDIYDDESQEGTTVTINGFEYQYLKLTCKHYGGYRSTSKGIRPNQKTAKLMCPTYIYACFDHYKKKFIIKQMVVDCNHELKEENVLISKLFKDKDADNIPSNPNEATPKKKYVKIRNRNVLKIPLESPAVTNYVPSSTVRIKCNHELSESCEAATLTTEDLHSIVELFTAKSNKEQNDLICEWIQVLPYSAANTVQVLFRLPAFDGSLVRVCYKAFSQVLKVSINRINELIISNYDELGNFVKNKQSGDSKEIENCIANILTSFSKEGDSEDTHQVIYCDTVDVPYAEGTIEESFIEENMTNAIGSSPSCNNESRDTDQLLNPLKPPVIKVSPSGDKFFLEINCEYNITIQNVSVENDGKTIKVAFSAK